MALELAAMSFCVVGVLSVAGLYSMAQLFQSSSSRPATGTTSGLTQLALLGLIPGLGGAVIIIMNRLTGVGIRHPWIALSTLVAGVAGWGFLLATSPGVVQALLAFGYVVVVIHHAQWVVGHARGSS